MPEGKPFDTAPFRLPNTPGNEVRFEETRDVESVEVVFAGRAPRGARLQYLRKRWPHDRIERAADLDVHRPSQLGWMGMDDS